MIIVQLDGGSGGGGTGITCTPLKSRCAGSILYTCTRSGTDESGYDCNDNSGPTYRSSCEAPCRARDAGACFVYTTLGPPQCAATVTSPEPFAETEVYTGQGYCSAPSTCAADTGMNFSARHTVQACPF